MACAGRGFRTDGAHPPPSQASGRWGDLCGCLGGAARRGDGNLADRENRGGLTGRGDMSRRRRYKHHGCFSHTPAQGQTSAAVGPGGVTVRRLAAIIAADVAGYSRLMHADEERTHAAFTAIMKGSVEPAVAQYGGRLVKGAGNRYSWRNSRAQSKPFVAPCSFKTISCATRPAMRKTNGSCSASASTLAT